MVRPILLSLALSGCVISARGATSPNGPPPPPREEAVQPRPGFVWITGRWEWQGAWVWLDGHWEREPATVAPAPPTPAPPPATEPAAPPQGDTLAVGENHTCTLERGQVRCWGANRDGMLGIDDPHDPGDGLVRGIDGTVVSIAAAGYHTCAITSDGAVWCWGFNHEGQVGNGDVSETPVIHPVRLRGLDHVRAVRLANTNGCAITTAGEVYCWGLNQQHQIDDSSRRNIPTPTHVRDLDHADLLAVGAYHVCVARGGTVHCRGSLAPLDRQLASLTHVTALSAGWQHSCALQDGKAYCWGENYLGILGSEDACGRANDCTSQLHPPRQVPGIEGATQLSTLIYHSCVVGAAGAVTCWGNNQSHAFADDLPAEPHQPPHVIAGVTADRVFAGGGHTCVQRAGAPRCWGHDAGVRGTR